MRFREMEIFHAVMQQGTVSGAAKKLRISQPSVTKLLQQAEQDLGYDLFDRVRGRLYPTSEARALHAEVKRAYSALETVRGLSRRLGGNYVGHFRVAAPPALALQLLPHAIRRFVASHTAVTIEISSQHSGDILGTDARLSSRFDLGFTFGAETAPGMNIVELGRAQIMCAVPRSLAPGLGERFSLADVAGLPFVLTDESEPLGRQVASYCLENGLILNSGIKAHAHHVAAELAACGIGATVLDWFTASYHRDRFAAADVALVELGPGWDLPVTAVYFADEGLPLPARRFVSAVHDELRSLQLAGDEELRF